MMTPMALTRSKCGFAPASCVKPMAVRPSARMVVRAQKAETTIQHVLRPAAVTAVANVLMALPASAEAGKLFDFGLTLPIMTAQFVLLMIFLEKTWFTPVGKLLDDRDALLRDRLGSVKDGSAELDKLAAEAEAILKAARTEVSAMINSQKNAKQTELDKIYADAKLRVSKEADAAIASLEAESKVLLQKLDAQVEKISEEVLKRVLPRGVKV